MCRSNEICAEVLVPKFGYPDFLIFYDWPLKFHDSLAMPLNLCSSFHRFLDTLFWLDIDTFVDLLDFLFGDEINAEYKTHLESRLKGKM